MTSKSEWASRVPFVARFGQRIAGKDERVGANPGLRGGGAEAGETRITKVSGETTDDE